MSDPDVPHRRRGLKAFIAIAVVLLLIVGLLWLWGAAGAKRLDSEVAALKAAGEPMELSDFVATAVAPQDNAAMELMLATVKDSTPAMDRLDKMTLALPLIEEEMAAIRAVLAENSASLEHVDAALKLTGVDWRVNLQSPAIHVLLPHLNTQRHLAWTLSNRSLLRQQEGDHAAAMRDVERMIFQSRAIDHQQVLVTHLVSVGVLALATNRAADAAADLRIGSESGAAAPGQVATLIAQLLDDKPLREGMHNALQMERMMELDTARCVTDGRLSISSLSSPGGGSVASSAGQQFLEMLGRPVVNGDAVICLRYTTAVIQASDAARDWPTAKKTLPPYPKAVTERPARHFFAKMMLPSFERAIQTNYRMLSDARLAATALAVRWYATEHGGTLPKTLDELVPKYLAAVPLDPFAMNQPLKYIADPKKPMVYSVGEDGADDGGSEAPRNKRPNASRWDQLDWVQHLKRQPRPAPVKEEELDDGVGGLSTRPTTASSTTQSAP